jgi:hypothetical protein
VLVVGGTPDKDPLQVELNKRNLDTLYEVFGVLSDKLDTQADRIRSMENEIATTKALVQKQSAVIGQALQRVMGSGSTVRE